MSGKVKSPGPAEYKLKTLTGATDHDFTKNKRPAWTMGGVSNRFPAPEFKSPGPAYGSKDITGQNRFGDKPKIAKTVAGKNIYDPKNKVPGPADHNVHQIPVDYYKGQKGPAFTMAQSKAPLFYERIPGPFDTHLQDSNTVKPRAPAYTLAGLTGIKERPEAPGPSYPGNIQKDNTLNKSPQYSLGQILQPLRRDKAAEFVDLSGHNPFKKTPKFTFGVKYSDSTWVPFVPDDHWCC